MAQTKPIKMSIELARQAARWKLTRGTDLILPLRREIRQLEQYFLPSGNGIDLGTTLSVEDCSDAKLVFNTAIHHMNPGGFYDRWTEHTVTVRLEFGGYDIRVSGSNHNEVKDYIAEVFVEALDEEVVKTVDDANEVVYDHA